MRFSLLNLSLLTLSLPLLAAPLTVGSYSAQGSRETQEDRVVVLQQGKFVGVFDGHNGSSCAEFMMADLMQRLLGIQSTNIAQQLVDAFHAADEAFLNDAPAQKVSLPNEAQPSATQVMPSLPSDAGPSLADFFAAIDAAARAAQALPIVHTQPLTQTEKAAKWASTSGTTATVSVSLAQVLYIAHAGDSRAVVSYTDGRFQETSDHQGAALAEKRRIGKGTEHAQLVGGSLWSEHPWDASDHTHSLEVTRALGDPYFKLGYAQPTPLIATPEVMSIDESTIHFVIIASDGLWKKMDTQEAVRTAQTLKAQGKTAAEIAEILATTALARQCGDNTSVVVLFY